MSIGHAGGGSTGVTVILFPEGAVAGVDLRGGATGTRGIDPCRPGHLVERIHAICLAGGSSFGLAAAGGVMRYLEERGVGFPTSAGPVPIVPSAILYDLGVGDARERPDEAMGYAACVAATALPPAEGSVGAGTGATVGKVRGRAHSTKGGIGYALARRGRLVVAALAVVNAFGDVVDSATGAIVAGARADGGGFLDTEAAMADGVLPLGFGGGRPAEPSTTLVVVMTNAKLDRDAACRVATAGSTGMCRAIRPVHARFDGDVVFALATGVEGAPRDQVAALAAGLVAEAIVRGVRSASSRLGIPAATELPRA
jgi:L-aminopeptidase/D-esterase-like protein